MSKLIKPVCICICVIVVQFGSAAPASLQFICVQTYLWSGGQAEGTNLGCRPSSHRIDKIEEKLVFVTVLIQSADKRQTCLWTNTSTAFCVPVPGSLKAGGEEGGGRRAADWCPRFPLRRLNLQTDLLHQTNPLSPSDSITQFDLWWSVWRPDYKLRLYSCSCRSTSDHFLHPILHFYPSNVRNLYPVAINVSRWS